MIVNAPEAKPYELIGYFTQAADYGDLQVSVNGTTLKPIVRGYHDGVIATGPISFGRVPMHSGPNEITLDIVGKAPQATGYLAGLDGFVLK